MKRSQFLTNFFVSEVTTKVAKSVVQNQFWDRKAAQFSQKIRGHLGKVKIVKNSWSLQSIEMSESSRSELTGRLNGSLSLEKSISFVLQVKKVLCGLNSEKSIVTARTNEDLALTSKKCQEKDGVVSEVHKSTTDSKYRIEIELDKV